MNNNKYKILLVEDDLNISLLVTALLESADYRVILAETCAAAETMYASHLPDLIILDLGLPDRDGMHLLEWVRKDSLTPIIVLSARAGEQDKVRALDLGANDYITKPFGVQELLARIRAVLRNNRHSSADGKRPGGKFTLHDLSIDYDARRVFVNGKEVKLTQTEYNIVTFLSAHSGKVMPYSAIIKAIWGYAYEGSVKKLQVNMANIRKKLSAQSCEHDYIVNEAGIGYRMKSESD